MPDRSSGVGAQAQWDGAGRDRRGSSTAASAGSFGGVPRVAGHAHRAGFGAGTHREFVHVGFANDDRTRVFQSSDHGRIVWRDETFQHLRRAGGRHVRGAKDIFDRDGQACQRSQSFACSSIGVHGFRGLHRGFFGNVRERIDRRLRSSDGCERLSDDLDCGDFAGIELFQNFRGRMQHERTVLVAWKGA